MKKMTPPLLLLCPWIFFACSKLEPVPVTECNKVISHAKKILGARAPTKQEMTKQCQEASDEARACVLDADKPMKMLQCDF